MMHALRQFRKNPGFTFAAVLSLALGTGANTAIFSLIDAVMLRSLPVAHPEQLVLIKTNTVKLGAMRVSPSISVNAIDYIGAHATSISGIGGEENERRVSVTIAGQTDRAAVHFLTPAYFSVLGVNPHLGRTLNSGDANPNARVAVLSHGFWQRRFGGDPSVIGREIEINRVPFVIVGVAAREFYGLASDYPFDAAVPIATIAQVRDGKLSSEWPKANESAGYVVARLNHGVNMKQVSAELTPLLQQALLRDAESGQRFQAISNVSVDVTPAAQGISNMRLKFSEPLKVLMAVVAMVLLIACANIANLLLAKSSTRRREIAIRMSVGASRWRLVRQLFAESLVLAGAGGAVGFLLAIWARDAIIRIADVPDAALQWDYRVIGFTAAVCLLSAVLFGIMPAIRATSLDLATAMKSASPQVRGRFTLGRALIAVQVGLSLVLLTGAGLFLYTFRNLDQIDLGYARKDALWVTLDPGLAGYRGARAGEVYQQAMDRVAGIPGVRSVVLMRDRLMTGNVMMTGILVPGYAPKQGEDPAHMWAISNSVGPKFFKTFGIQLLAGRDFTEADNERAQKVAVVSESMAQHFFGTANAVGRVFSEGPGEPPIQIVGVVRDVKYFGVRDSKQDMIFRPAAQSEPSAQSTLLIRTSVDPSRAVEPVRAAIRAMDASLPIYDVISVDEQVEKSLSLQRLVAMLSTFFGALALVLATIGLYGVLSYAVAQRTPEIGIRMALGARPGVVLRMIFSETARVICVGIAAGVAIALAGARFLESILYGIKPTDAATMIMAAAILLGAAFAATLLPARRASKVDPMIALRND